MGVYCSDTDTIPFKRELIHLTCENWIIHDSFKIQFINFKNVKYVIRNRPKGLDKYQDQFDDGFAKMVEG